MSEPLEDALDHARRIATSEIILSLIRNHVEEKAGDIIRRFPTLKGEEQEEAARRILYHFIRAVFYGIDTYIKCLDCVERCGEDFMLFKLETKEDAMEVLNKDDRIHEIREKVFMLIKDLFPDCARLGDVDAFVNTCTSNMSKAPDWFPFKEDVDE